MYYYLRNGQGDIVGIMDSSYTTVVQYSYDTWGKLISTTGSLASTLGALNPFRYRGYVYDTETQLYYLNSRYYDPETCRFISADSQFGKGMTGYNLYAYCNNNVVNGFDPCGTCFHRLDFWNDCQKCGGRTIGEKLEPFTSWCKDAYSYITNNDSAAAQNNLKKDGFTFL